MVSIKLKKDTSLLELDPNIEEIELISKTLKSIPEEVFNFKLLKKLVINFSKLEILDFRVFKEFPNLTYLRVSNGQFCEIDEISPSLTKLKELHLYNNKLTSLPDFIGELKTI